MQVSMDEVVNYLSVFILPFARIFGFFLFAPLLSFTEILFKIKLGLALVISVLLAPIVTSSYNISVNLNDWQVIGLIILEFAIGALFGFVMQIFFQIFASSGQLIATQTSFDNGFQDDSNFVSMNVISQIYLMLVYLVYLAIDGHLLLLEILKKSFFWVQIVNLDIKDNIFWQLIEFGYYIFTGSLFLALPIIAALFVVNITFGLIQKTFPNFNSSILTVPLILIISLIIISISLTGFTLEFNKIFMNLITSFENFRI